MIVQISSELLLRVSHGFPAETVLKVVDVIGYKMYSHRCQKCDNHNILSEKNMEVKYFCDKN